ncbi:MAG: hypothetical protein JWN04_2412, partial [Myxococcaceae bacterium]|nr:hypothetical protein [Myxococcaceae bacterium]
MNRPYCFVPGFMVMVAALCLVGCGRESEQEQQAQSALSGPAEADASLGCRPDGSDMYGCHTSAGGPGLNCHNPKLGCASSALCGGGCDLQVSGRCSAVEGGKASCGHPDAGNCVSSAGGPCGGNTRQACSCAAGLTCVPEAGLPPEDVGGTCEPRACVQNVLCVKGSHFDPKLCRCVPDAP